MDEILEILNLMCLMSQLYDAYIKYRKRRWWVRPVNLNRDIDGFFVKSFLKIKHQDEEHFIKLTRMGRSKFDMLLTLLKERLTKTSFRKPIGPECRLGLTLMFLAHGCSPQILAWSFKIGVSTVKKIIYSTCAAIWDELYVIYMAAPNQHEWSNIAEEFWIQKRLPNCLGAIDGKQINCVCPRRSASLYYDYKKNFSIKLLGVCDAKYTFTLTDVGAYGSQSDGAVFNRSWFGKKILQNTLNIPARKILPNSDITFPHFFVADAAFPLKENLMRPYPGHNLSIDKLNFNRRLSKARVVIENTFGILANRWRILLTRIHCNPKHIDHIILATLVLHNLLMLDKNSNYFTNDLVDSEENGAIVPGRWRTEGTILPSASATCPNRASRIAFGIRDTLKDYLHEN